MRLLAVTALAAGAIIGVSLPPATAGPDFCTTFVEKNKDCESAMRDRCMSAVTQKMNEQIALADEDQRPQLEAMVEARVPAICEKMMDQITGDNAAPTCHEKVNSTDPRDVEQKKTLETCMTKSSCEDYAVCAIELK